MAKNKSEKEFNDSPSNICPQLECQSCPNLFVGSPESRQENLVSRCIYELLDLQRVDPATRTRSHFPMLAIHTSSGCLETLAVPRLQELCSSRCCGESLGASCNTCGRTVRRQSHPCFPVGRCCACSHIPGVWYHLIFRIPHTWTPKWKSCGRCC